MDKRIYSLDALRAIMLLLGIVIHSAASYTTIAIFPWPVKDKSVSVLFDYLVLNIHSFRIPVFFVLAGFFLAMQYSKRGLKNTYLNRVFRILFPFIASMILIAPLTRIIFMHFVQKLEWNVILNSIISLKIYINIFTGHLWFLYYLFIVISIFHIVKIVKIKVLKHLHEQVGKILNRNSFIAFVLFSVISFVCILIQQKGYIESNIKLTPDPFCFRVYIV
ncbi:MAG: acyltransferase family protein [Bacteroidetes bacterium]|nr:acyltransferase family protein [Bacteroidota bacterium]